MLDIYGYRHTHTHTHTEYLIPIAVPPHQWLCQRLSMLPYTYIFFCRKFTTKKFLLDNYKISQALDKIINFKG